MAVVTGNEQLVRTGPGRILVGPYGTTLPTTMVATLDAALREIGFTTEGSEVEYTQNSEGITVAERLRPIRYENTTAEMLYRFAMAEISVENLALATNADPDTAITETADTIRFDFPKTGGSNRQSVVWEADDGLERLVLVKCFSSGSITIPRRKAPDFATVPVEFRIEEVTGGADAYYMASPDLVA